MIFITVFVASALINLVTTNFVFALFDPDSSNIYLNMLIGNSDQVNTGKVSTIGFNDQNTENVQTSDLKQDITGKYSNTQYGIANFDIPAGWFATEGMNGNNGIIIAMHPGTTQEFFDKLSSGAGDEPIPIMNLVVQDKADLRERQNSAQSSENPFSLSTDCAELKPNATESINNKLFQISTMKCSTTDQNELAEIDFSTTELLTSYTHESQSKLYILQLILSSDYSPKKIVNDADIEKFHSTINSAIQTLQIN
jgi:hypothetical protein